MRTVVLGPRPPLLEELIERRRALGQDTFDEVWDGDYHMAPGPSAGHGRVDDELTVLLRPLATRAGLVRTGAFNLGSPSDYRVPDGGFHRGEPQGLFLPSAAVVVEIVSPGDETFAKLPFYAEHGVEEAVIADAATRQVRLWQRGTDGRLAETGRSDLLGVTARGRVPGPV